MTAPSIEVPASQLEAIAAMSGNPIELPGDRAGWARVTDAHGNRYRAWLTRPDYRGGVR